MLGSLEHSPDIEGGTEEQMWNHDFQWVNLLQFLLVIDTVGVPKSTLVCQ